MEPLTVCSVPLRCISNVLCVYMFTESLDVNVISESDKCAL